MGLFEMLGEQFFGKPIGPTTSLEGRVVIVTGANTGLGLETAIHLARLHPKQLIITSRDSSKGEKALKTIRERADFSAECWELDLASFDSVKAFATRCEKLDRLDCLVENAGMTTLKWSQTGDGWESVLQVNGIATGLLGVLLLPLLEKTSKLPSPTSEPFRPHLTIVTSELHAFASFAESRTDGSILKALNDKNKAKIMDRYNISKLINVYTAQGISNLSSASGITVNTVNPGLCKSELRRSFKGILKLFDLISNLMARSGESGARNIAWASVDAPPVTPAAYISVSQIKPGGENLHTPAGKKLAGRVWGELVAEWIKIAPETEKVFYSQ